MKRKSYTAKEVAVMMGLSYQSVWKWCKGESIPDVENLLILSRILEVAMDDLIMSYDLLDKRIDELVMADSDWVKALDILSREKAERDSAVSDYIVEIEKNMHCVVVNKIFATGTQGRLLNCLKTVS